MRTKKVKKQKARDRLQRERRDNEIRKNEMVKRLLQNAKDDGFEVNYKAFHLVINLITFSSHGITPEFYQPQCQMKL